ncbi:hypothetical protein T458_07855 [Brevibacillus panacihumi W25]|uniref:Autoinducer 2-binding protein LsrB n=1 Tax=Brevibacillus panacihumi W25 TaxID=1408254 RepID=V6MAZ3_9BACL|nr:substrate-binding domain-containing protein [Brevibacillus panacihumi]EST55736.1 hypothetical protein T458_07855 [Brevibacillus panacihumi W25]
MKKRSLLLLALLLAFATLLAGCNVVTTPATENKDSGANANSSVDNSQNKTDQNIKVVMMPKAIGNSYFAAAHEGAKTAAADIKIDLTYNGPTTLNASQQVSMINGYVSQGYNVLAVSAADPTSLVPALQTAKQKGIKVVTWDSDVEPSARDFFVNQATSEGIGTTLVKLVAEKFNAPVDVAILSSTPSDPNQIDWINSMKKAIEEKYQNVNIVTTQYDNGQPDQALKVAGDLIKAYPNVKAIIAPESIALPGAAEAVEKAGKKGEIYVTGLANPAVMKKYVHNDTVEHFVLWDVTDLGKLTMHVSRAAADGTISENGTFKVEGLGEFEVKDGVVLLGLPKVFDKSNIDQFDY